MKKSVLAVLFAAMVCVIMAIAGCGGGSQSSKDVITVAGNGAVVDSIDPAKEWNGWYTVRYGVGETLFKIGKDMKPEPWLAEKFERVNPTTWKIDLKSNVVFSNGDKMTAEKVIESLQRVGKENKRAAVFATATYKAEGNSVIITTKEPYAGLINDLMDPYAAIVDVSATKDFAKDPIMTGPFTMKSFEANKQATMAKNDKYWNGAVKANEVIYKNVEDANTLALALQSGEVDIALDLTPAAAAQLDKDSKVVLTKTTQPRLYLLYFNMNKMADKNVREAIMYAIDKKDIGDKHLNGGMTATKAAFLDSSDFGSKAIKGHDFNVEKAKELLAAAGYKDTNGDGILEKDGKPLTVTLSIYKRLGMDAIATEMQSELKKVGIQMNIDKHEKANFYAPGDFEMGLYSVITTPTGNPYAFLRDTMLSNGKANYGHYLSSQVDQDIISLSATNDPSEVAKLVTNIQQTALDDAAYDFLGFNVMYTGLSKSIKGYETAPNDYYQVTQNLEKE